MDKNHDLHYSPIVTQIKEDELGGACGTHREQTYRALVGAAEGKNTLGRPMADMGGYC